MICYGKHTYGSNFYFPVVDLKLNFNEARNFCEKEGGDLASIEFGCTQLVVKMISSNLLPVTGGVPTYIGQSLL